MGKLLHFVLDFIPGGPIIRGVLGGIVGLFNKGSFLDNYQKANANRPIIKINYGHATAIFLGWYLILLTGYFIPVTQPYVADGFRVMDATLPNEWKYIMHIIVGSLFGMHLGHRYIDSKSSSNGFGADIKNFLVKK